MLGRCPVGTIGAAATNSLKKTFWGEHRYWPIVHIVRGQSVKDIIVEDMRVPSGATCIALLHATMHDAAIYKEPEQCGAGPPHTCALEACPVPVTSGCSCESPAHWYVMPRCTCTESLQGNTRWWCSCHEVRCQIKRVGGMRTGLSRSASWSRAMRARMSPARTLSGLASGCAQLKSANPSDMTTLLFCALLHGCVSRA